VKKAAKHLRLVLSWRENIGTGDYYFSFLLLASSPMYYTLFCYIFEKGINFIVMISLPCMLDLSCHGDASDP
jgi:hypothetical protein